jgi:hypothetical protein
LKTLIYSPVIVNRRLRIKEQEVKGKFPPDFSRSKYALINRIKYETKFKYKQDRQVVTLAILS